MSFCWGQPSRFPKALFALRLLSLYPMRDRNTNHVIYQWKGTCNSIHLPRLLDAQLADVI